MTEVAENQKDILIPLFSGLQDSLILSCIQNYFGTAWVDDCSSPASGRIISGDFCFLAGEPKEELLYGENGKLLRKGIIMVPDHSEWHPVIEKTYGSQCERKERYQIKKEGDIFDRNLLRKYINGLEDGYVLSEIDQSLYDTVISLEWCEDFCKQFRNWEHFHERGMGFVICRDGEIVAGASTYTSYREGIEIQIVTRGDYRRKGLALICSSALILKALENNLYPHWDAANMASVGVATKLGYHYDKPYTAYEVL